MTPDRGRRLSLLVLGGAVLAVAIALPALVRGPGRRVADPRATPAALAPVVSLPPDAVRVLAAGDIGRCGSLGAAATGALLDAIPDATVLTLGDNAYENGSAEDYRRCYDPVWGGARERTIPIAGNHDVRTPGAAGYHGYFGTAAGSPEAPWRAVDLGAWRIYALESECARAGACGDDSAQLAWLAHDLAASPRRCTLALLHRPRFSSGPHGDQTSVDPLWRMLASAGVDLVLGGHDHLYERFAPKDADGLVVESGLRAWTVGTGGADLYDLGEPRPGSEARWDRAFGVLELVLRPDGYDWRFRTAIGDPFEDTGSGSC